MTNAPIFLRRYIATEKTAAHSRRNIPNANMGLDPLSPVAPARVRALLLPLGRIKRSRFGEFVERLLLENVVRLGDVSPDGRSDRSIPSKPFINRLSVKE